MKVIKRDGSREEIKPEKIKARIDRLKQNINGKTLDIDTDEIAVKVISGLFDGVNTWELDELAAEISASMTIRHPDYDKLAARLEVSSLHKITNDVFSDKMAYLYSNGNISFDFFQFVQGNKKFLDSLIDYEKDYSYDYFGFKTLKKGYLLKDKNNKIIERPQDMLLRVAAFVNSNDLKMIEKVYKSLSNKEFTHATPSLFNAGTVRPQMSSCFLLDINDDSIPGIYKTLSDCAVISQSAGGIGLSIHKIRSSGSSIKGTNGTSNGIVPMLRVFDATMRYVDQGGGKRKGSAAVYIEPWHSDIFEFLELKKNHGKEEMRARDLFYAMWIPDLFMQRVEEDGSWTLFDPKEAKALIELVGEDFKTEYERLESITTGNGGIRKRIKARDLWNKIVESQIETGTPYMLYKDAANLKSNQQNLGTIKSSNLCTEIIEYTDENETAVCNLASISLPNFCIDGVFSHEKLYDISRVVTRSLNMVIDVTYYPTKETKASNLKHRPIGIGVQGLADVFAMLKLPFTSDEAKLLNKNIFETIYKGSVDESIQLAKEQGAYESYEGSPSSFGRLQFDLWNYDRSNLYYNWEETFKELKKYGMRNSLLLAPMPTASTSQILGNTECFEPITSNLYSRRTLSGEFIIVNKHLVNDLAEVGLWDKKMSNTIMKQKGSIQKIDIIPDSIKERYKTAYELSMKDVIDMSADRGLFICQSQSLNMFVENATVNKITSMHFYGWKKGLKTGQYYLRTKAATDAIQFTVNDNDCLMCSG
jgi:ribonucleoside-diphosphate reductase alpha chain